MTDPLVYGHVDERIFVESINPRSTTVSSPYANSPYTGSKSPFFKPEKQKHAEMDKQDIEDKTEFEDILNRVKTITKERRRERKQERRQKQGDSSVVTTTSINPTTELSKHNVEPDFLVQTICTPENGCQVEATQIETTDSDMPSLSIVGDDIDNVRDMAKQTSKLHICLLSMDMYESPLISSWRDLCKSSPRAVMLHKISPSVFVFSYPSIVAFNKLGECIMFDASWINVLLQKSSGLRSIYAIGCLDRSNEITSLSQLKDGQSAFVYDAMEDECHSLMEKWVSDDNHSTIDRRYTNQPKCCVIRRENQMFHVFNA